MNALRTALSIAAFAALGAVAAAPADARAYHQTVAGWRITLEYESGDRTVYLRRHRRGYRVDLTYEFWRGNGGVSTQGTFERGACRSGDTGAIVPFAQGMTRRFLDSRLTDYLRECPLPRAEALALRRSLNAAWPRFNAWIRRARAEMDAENRAITNYGH